MIMKYWATPVVAILALAACGQGAQTPAPTQEAAVEAAAPALVAAADAIAADAVNPCFLSGAQLSSALGGSYQDGVGSDRSAPYLRRCEYRGNDNDVHVSAYWMDAGMPLAPVSGTLGANPEPVAGDADSAVYEPPVVTGGCTLAYRKANVTYTIQIMQCRSVADARARLLALPRPWS
jgi:hypothetical protein